MKLSIVTTLYMSSNYVDEFYQRITKTAQKITDDYEIIFVDDGSPDHSLQKCIELHRQDSKIKIIELSRNFGHHKAIMTGLSNINGDYVYLTDIDLEEKPELLYKFWNEMQNDSSLDVVYGAQKTRKGSWFERLSGEIFFTFFNYLSDIKLPKNLLITRLMTRQFVESLVAFKERELVFNILLELTGFKSKKIVVEKLSHSPSTYSLRMKLILFLKSVVSATAKPLWIIFGFGLLVTSVSFIYIIILFWDKFFNNIGIDGWTSIMVLVIFFGGAIIFCLGIIGIYLSNIFVEVKNRPYSIIKKIHQRDENG